MTGKAVPEERDRGVALPWLLTIIATFPHPHR